MKKNILHIIDTLGFGGAEILLNDSLPDLVEFNNIVCVLKKPAVINDNIKNFKLYVLDYNSKLDFFKVSKELKNIIKTEKVDLIHSHLIYSSWLVSIVCPKNVVHVKTLHNLLSQDAFNVNKLSLYMERFLYKKSCITLGVSQAVLDDYKRYINVTGQSIVLYNFVKDKFFDSYSSLRKTHNIPVLKLITVGNLRRQKNYFNLVNAFIYLKDYPISLDIYGKGELKNELETIITKENLKVTIISEVSDISTILANYDCFIQASMFEGYGIAVVEAMATGVPLLLSDINVFKEVAEDNAIYFNQNDSKLISDTILKVYKNQLTLPKTEDIHNHALKIGSRKNYIKKLTNIYTNS